MAATAAMREWAVGATSSPDSLPGVASWFGGSVDGGTGAKHRTCPAVPSSPCSAGNLRPYRTNRTPSLLHRQRREYDRGPAHEGRRAVPVGGRDRRGRARGAGRGRAALRGRRCGRLRLQLYAFSESTAGQTACCKLGLTGIPIFNANNACASGGTALCLARSFVQSGGYGVVLALGFDSRACAAAR